jgi:hypothetical protein
MEVNLRTLKGTFLGVCAIGLISAHVPAKSQPSAATCDNYARNYAESASRQGQVLRGGAAGGLVGLALGSIGGAAGAGAAIGAGIGMIGGGMNRTSAASKMYESAYIDCMGRR